ncbi:MAG TPA: hypothetical protein VFV34_12115, partial [Blastocatellia bacterium]|nr:hypothetical protein [Blastocatellia bacterium]
MPNIASIKRSARALIWAILAAWLLAGPGSASRAEFATVVRGSVGQTAQTPTGPTAATSGNRLPDLPVLKPTLSGTLYENVVTVLERRYYDERFRKDVLPGLASKHSDPSKRAGTLLEERQAVHGLLSEIPATHLGLLSKRQFGNIAKDLNDQPYPTFGLQLVEVEGKQYAFMVLENGPAARAGVLPWDRVVSIDDVAAEKSERLDWRTDDAYLADDRDPPVRPLIANAGDQIKLKLERKRGKFVDLTIRA